MRHQECFAVKTGHDGLLDVARKTYTDILADIAQVETACQQQLADYCACKLHFTEKRGYHLVLPPSAAQQIEKGVLGLVGLLTAFVSGDAEEFTDEVFAVSEQAVTISDACGLG